MPQPVSSLGKRIASMRLASQIVIMLVIALTLFAIAQCVRDQQIRAIIITGCIVLVCIPILIRGASMLFTRRWLIGLVCLILGPLLSIGLFTLGAHLVDRMISRYHNYQNQPPPDTFADHLTIPTDLELTDAIRNTQPGWRESFDNEDRSIDTLQMAVLEDTLHAGDTNATITANIDALDALNQKAPEILQRYLETSPQWKVTATSNPRMVSRRGYMFGQWFDTRRGELDIRLLRGRRSASLSLELGFPYIGYGKHDPLLTELQPGQTGTLKASYGYTKIGTTGGPLEIQTTKMAIRIHSMSSTHSSRLSRLALTHLQSEFQPLAANPSWETILSLLPAGSVRTGEPSLDIHQIPLPSGAYTINLYINPGQSGVVYFKAYEITHGTPLHEKGIYGDTEERGGWSNDPSQQFFYNSHFELIPGNPGQPYAVRFEVWFKPDTVGPDRKLMEKNFKVEGR